ncbi:MAG: M23 family metallopeptidase [Candidatus Roizmanbacteria bacterium]|nr:M23 family metallopeptidase [Candidatus Roizmanbacteria bacterium]
MGIMGSTGRSSGTHLHFEIRSGGQILDPLGFLK